MKLEVITRTPASPSRPTPILCVHGGYHAAWCWDERFLPYFAEQGYTAHALSLRGHGNSAGHEHIKRWRLADYVADVEQIMATLSRPPVLVGHSLGGVVVQKVLERQTTPAGVLLAASPTRGMLGASLRMLLRYPRPMLKTFLTLDLIHARPAFASVFFSPEVPRHQVQAHFQRMDNESFRAFMDIAFFDKPQPQRVRAPMLVIGGQRDTSIPQSVNLALARAYATQLETFPVAHDMMLEPGWQPVAQRIVGWLGERGL